MRQVGKRALWIGNVGSLRDARALFDAGVQAVVFLATDLVDPPGRELVLCRIPLFDGEGNETWRLRLAVGLVVSLIAEGVPTLVCCSNGMSRSVAVVAAALAKCNGGSADEQLKQITVGQPADVSPMFWRELCAETFP